MSLTYLKAVITFAANSLMYYFPTLDRFRGPTFVNWQLTYRCQGKCSFCNTHNLEKENSSVMSLERKLEVIDELSLLRVAHVSLTGGEPFLLPELPAIVDHLVYKNIFVNINTNGAALYGNLQWLKNSHVHSLTISVDDWRPSVHETQRGIADLCQKIKECCLIIKSWEVRPKIILRAVIHKSNYDQLEHYLAYWSKYADQIVFQPIHHSIYPRHLDRGQQHLFYTPDTTGHKWLFSPEDCLSFEKQMTTMRRRFWRFNLPFYRRFSDFIFNFANFSGPRCAAGLYYATITPTGSVHGCTFLVGELGNLLHQSFASIWSSSDYRLFRSELKNRKNACRCWCGISAISQMMAWFHR